MGVTLTIPEDLILESNRFLDAERMKPIFDLLAANIFRSKRTFSIVFVSMHPLRENYLKNSLEIEKKVFIFIGEFLQEQIRKSDLLFRLSNNCGWGILLSHSGEEEAKHFIKRILKEVPPFVYDKNEELTIHLSVSIAEIAGSNINFEDVMKRGETSLSQAIKLEKPKIDVIEVYKERENEQIKVSIIENDDIISHILQSVIERTTIDYFELEYRTFQDGYEFLQSSWYQSSHTHLVIVNDILPKKNGIEVVHTLRKMPNNRKYIILLMSKRNSQEDMIYAYEMVSMRTLYNQSI